MESSSPLFKSGAYIFLGAGILMLLIGVYIAGSDNMTCSAKDDRIDCVLEYDRFLGMVKAGQVSMRDVTSVFIRTGTTDHTTITPAGNRHTTTSTNDTLVLKLRNGQQLDTLGGEQSFQYGSQIEELIKNPKRGPVDLSDSYSPVAAALGGLGIVIGAFGAIAIRFS